MTKSHCYDARLFNHEDVEAARALGLDPPKLRLFIRVRGITFQSGLPLEQSVKLLDSEQKRALVRSFIEADPSLSDGEIVRRAHVHRDTVDLVRIGCACELLSAQPSLSNVRLKQLTGVNDEQLFEARRAFAQGGGGRHRDNRWRRSSGDRQTIVRHPPAESSPESGPPAGAGSGAAEPPEPLYY